LGLKPAPVVRDDPGWVVDNATTPQVSEATSRAFNVSANPDWDSALLVPHDFSFFANGVYQCHRVVWLVVARSTAWRRIPSAYCFAVMGLAHAKESHAETRRTA